MRFAAPYWLLLLSLVPAVFAAHFWQAKTRRRDQAALGEPGLLRPHLLVGSAGGRNARLASTWLLALTVGLMSLALARPQFGLHTEVRKGRGMDLVYALDLSRSMLAKDVVPSRLERAKIELSQLADALPGDRIGLVGFTSLALPLCPLTVDHAALKLQLSSATPEDLPRGGTSIGAAIDAGLKLLKGGDAKGAERAIIVVTDGEEHESVPKAAAARAKAAGVSVSVVGVGSTSGEPIPLFDPRGRPQGYLKDRAGHTVISKLNGALLTELAEAGGGQAALPGPAGLDLSPIRASLLSKRRTELEDRVVRVYQERFQWALAPAALLLLLSLLSRPSRPRRGALAPPKPGPGAGGLLGVALLVALAAGGRPAQAQPMRDDPDVAEGNQALRAGDAQAAAEAYKRAEARLGRDPRLVFNQALADLGRGDEAQAMARFSRTLESAQDPTLRSKAAFALGNAYRRMKRFDKAVESYRQALMDDPTSAPARRNLELTQRMQALQPPQNKKQGDEDKKDKDKKDPNKDKQEGQNQDKQGKDGQQDQDKDAKDEQKSGEDRQQQQDAADKQDKGDNKGPGQDGQQQADKDKKRPGQDEKKDPQAEKSAKQPQGDKKKAAGEQKSDKKQKPTGAAPAQGAPDGQAQDAQLQQAEAILDALGEQEKALKRARIRRRYRGPAVNKDW